MEIIDYDEWKRQKPAVTRARLRADERFQGRAPGRRPRDPEKEQVLARLDKARWARHIASGKLIMVGPRKWMWRVDFDD